MRTHGIMARLARLEDRHQPKGPRQIVVQWPGEPLPEVLEGAVVVQVVRGESAERRYEKPRRQNQTA